MMAPNVRHNFRDTRWTLYDKISQYKGLVRLYERDKKVLQGDRRVTERKQKKLIHQIKNDIDENRDELIKAVNSDPQTMRNILLDHKDLTLTFQNHTPEKTIEHLQHKNFVKRKALDRLQFLMKRKAGKLTDLKLQAAAIEDNILYDNIHEIPETRKCQMISGKVQEAMTKQEAALQVQRIYKQIIEILNKDKLCYDYVLSQLRLDSKQQNQCICQTMTLGQLATEYTDDRKQELDLLKRTVKRDLISRQKQLELVMEQVATKEDILGNYLRKESVVNCNKEVKQLDPLEIKMRNEVSDLKHTLDVLKDLTFVSNFESIFSCIEEQQNTYNKMLEILKRKCEDRDKLRKKIEHARIMYSQLSNKIEESTFQYMEGKKTVSSDLQAAQENLRQLSDSVQNKSKVLVDIRTVLINLQKMCKVIHIPDERRLPFSKPQTIDIIPLPEPLENRSEKIIDIVAVRLTMLVNANTKYTLDNKHSTNIVNIFKNYQEYVLHNRPVYEQHVEEVEDAWLIEIPTIDSNVKTYTSVKAESQYIVEQGIKSELQ